MAKVQLSVLHAQDIQSLDISLTDCLGLVEQSFSQHGLKQVENPPKPGIHTRDQAFIHAMPAFLKGTDVCGIKWVSGYTSNREKGLPTIVGMIVLNDTETGLPLALMDGTWITNTRTAAATGVTARRVLRGDEKILGIIGCGMQGIYNTLVLSLVMPHVETVRVYDPFQPSIDRFKAAIAEKLPKLKIEVMNSIEEAIRASEAIIWAVPPIEKGQRPVNTDWMQPGSTLFTISNSGLNKDFRSKVKFVTDDFNQYTSFFGDYYSGPEPYGESGELVCGSKPGRTSKEEVIVVSNVGLAIHDIVVADFVLKKAQEAGLGSTITLDNDCSKPAPIPRL